MYVMHVTTNIAYITTQSCKLNEIWFVKYLIFKVSHDSYMYKGYYKVAELSHVSSQNFIQQFVFKQGGCTIQPFLKSFMYVH